MCQSLGQSAVACSLILFLVRLRLPKLWPPRKYLINNPQLHCLLRTHELIPLHQQLDLVQGMRLRQMPLINLIQLLPDPQDLFRVDGDIGRLPEVAAARLMHHHAAVRQAIAFLGGAAAQQQRAHGGGLPHAGGGHGRGDVGHGVVDGEAGGDGAARRVDVQLDGLFRRVGFEEEELGDDGGGDGFVDRAVEADDAFLDLF